MHVQIGDIRCAEQLITLNTLGSMSFLVSTSHEETDRLRIDSVSK